jgi:hypothetical protein
MYPIDVQGRKLLAAERFQLLATDARVSFRPAQNLRRRLGRLVIAAGLRLALGRSGAHCRAERARQLADLVGQRP